MPITGSGLGVNPLFLPAGTLGLPTETIVTLSELAGVTANLQATGTTAGTTDAVVQLTPNVATALGISGNTLIAALSDFGTLNWSQYVGPIPATADALNVATNWSAPAAIGPRYGAELETRLASGPAGIYVGYVVPTGVAADQELVVRKFDGAGWSAPVTIARNVSFPDLVQDPAGRLHALWADTAGLHYRSTTNAANTTWDAGQLIATGDHYAVARLSVNAAGNGWATWAGSTGVQAIPLHGFYTGPAVATTDSGFGADYQLKGIPKGCVQPGQQFTVTLSWKRQKRKGNLFVKVRRTDFYLGTSKLRTDNSAPFTYTFQVRVTQPRGSTVSLRARAFIKVRHGKTPKKSIFAKVKVCAAP
jgi:hypothetical protein